LIESSPFPISDEPEREERSFSVSNPTKAGYNSVYERPNCWAIDMAMSVDQSFGMLFVPVARITFLA
jgi:hypothetical protein